MQKILLVLMLACQMASAQSNSVQKEMIVQVPSLSEWKVYKISKQLACLDGIRYLGYFKERSYLLLHVDAEKITDTGIITALIHHLNEKMKTDVITGISIYDALDYKLTEQ